MDRDTAAPAAREGFGDRLAKALALADESRDGLASALGISVQAISQVVTGASKAMSAENTVNAARHLSVSAIWLATGQGEPRGTDRPDDSPGAWWDNDTKAFADDYQKLSRADRQVLRKLYEVVRRERR